MFLSKDFKSNNIEFKPEIGKDYKQPSEGKMSRQNNLMVEALKQVSLMAKQLWENMSYLRELAKLHPIQEDKRKTQLE